MKKLLVLLLLFSQYAFGSSNRILDGSAITNGAATLTLPTSTGNVVTDNSSNTLTNKTLDFSANTASNIPASAVSSGQVSVSNGGTGKSSVTSNALLYGAGTSALVEIAPGSQYQSYQAGASGVPTVGAVHLDQSAAITGTLPIASGGTGQVSANSAFNALAPSQSTNSGKFLTTDGTNTSWASVAASTPSITGSQASPTSITAVGGISFSGTNYFNVNYIAGNGGAVTVSANPQITAATSVGQQLVIIGTSATNTVTLADGSGLSLNGSWVGSNNSAITLNWNGSVWTEVSRR